MRVAVVTPYYQESEEILEQCHQSVLMQNHRCEHVMVADGHPRASIDDWDCHHITLPLSHDDNGNTPRATGSLFAVNQGFDAIAYLDADNWYRPNHISSLVERHRDTGATVCASGRTFHRADGSELGTSEPGDGRNHFDTSCLFLTEGAFQLSALWALMPPMLSPLCDRLMYAALVHGNVQVAHTGLRTLAFRSQYTCHYTSAGETPPEGAKDDVASDALAQWNGLSESRRQMYFRRLGFSFRF